MSQWSTVLALALALSVSGLVVEALIVIVILSELEFRRCNNAIFLVLQVSLQDLYNGKTAKLAVQRNIICADCKGIGGKPVSQYCIS